MFILQVQRQMMAEDKLPNVETECSSPSTPEAMKTTVSCGNTVSTHPRCSGQSVVTSPWAYDVRIQVVCFHGTFGREVVSSKYNKSERIVC